MRDEKAGFAVLSTYAADGESLRWRGGAGRFGGSIARPVVAFLGAASAVAVVSVSFDGPAPATVRQPAVTTYPMPRTAPEKRPASRPASAIARDGPRIVADAAPGAPPASDARPALPVLAVLQPNPAQSVAPPDSRARAVPSAIDPPPQPEGLAADASTAPAPPCAAACLAELASGVGLDSVAAEPHEGPGEDVAPAALQADAGAPEDDGGPVPERAVALAARPGPGDEPPAGDGAQPPQGQVVTAEASVVSLARAGEAEKPAAAPATVAAESGSPGEPGEDAAKAGIAHHLARIDERYRAAPASQPSPPPPAAIDRHAAEAGEAVGEFRIDVARGAGVIVQEDELVAIRLGDLVSLVEDRLERPLYVWMKSSAAASKFVTAETLAAAGIRTRYDAERKQIVILGAGE